MIFDPEKIASAILDGLLRLAVTLWAWLSANTLGFIPTYVFVVILVVLGLVVWLQYGVKGLIAAGLAFLAIFELQRRATVVDPKPSKQWPDTTPPDKPKVRTLQDVFRRKKS